MKTLTLTGPLEGETRACMGFDFDEGELKVANDSDADKIYTALVKYYPVKIDVPVAEEAPVVHEHVPDETDIKVAEAKAEQDAREKAEAEAAAKAREEAEAKAKAEIEAKAKAKAKEDAE